MSKGSIRSRMPTVAAIFDEVRAQFPEAKLLYGKENGHEIDAREPEPEDCIYRLEASRFRVAQPARKERR